MKKLYSKFLLFVILFTFSFTNSFSQTVYSTRTLSYSSSQSTKITNCAVSFKAPKTGKLTKVIIYRDMSSHLSCDGPIMVFKGKLGSNIDGTYLGGKEYGTHKTDLNPHVELDEEYISMIKGEYYTIQFKTSPYGHSAPMYMFIKNSSNNDYIFTNLGSDYYQSINWHENGNNTIGGFFDFDYIIEDLRDPEITSETSQSTYDYYWYVNGNFNKNGSFGIKKHGILYSDQEVDLKLENVGETVIKKEKSASYNSVINTGTTQFYIGTMTPNTKYKYVYYVVDGTGNVFYSDNKYYTTPLPPKQDQTITFNELQDVTYGITPFKLEATSTSGLTVEFETSDQMVATIDAENNIHIHKVAPVSITAYQDGDDSYNAAPDVVRELTIVPKELTTTYTEQQYDIYYGDDNPVIEYTLEGFVNEDDITSLNISQDYKHGTGENPLPGTYGVITPVYHNDNYTINHGSTPSLIIHKRPLNINIDIEQHKISYGEVTPSFNFTLNNFAYQDTENDLENIETLTVYKEDQEVLDQHKLKAGEYTLQINNYFSDNRYIIEDKIPYFVDKATLIVEPEPKSKIYGEETPTGFSCDISNYVYEDGLSDINIPMLTLDVAIGAIPDLYNYTLTGDDPNYTFELTEHNKFEVKKAPLEIGIKNCSKIYGEENPTFEYTFSGFLFDDNKDGLGFELPNTFQTSASLISNVGLYDVITTPLDTPDDKYEISFTKGTLTINKAPLRITIDDKEKFYGDVDPEFTYTITGFKNNETEESINEYPIISVLVDHVNIGTYEISASNSIYTNYSATQETGQLTIKKAPLTFNIEDKFITYGDPLPVFTSTIEGFKNGENSDVLDDFPSFGVMDYTQNAGDYIITYATIIEDKNYEIIFNDGNLKVNKAPLDAFPNDVKIFTGKTGFETTIHYEGFVYEEDKSVLDKEPNVILDPRIDPFFDVYNTPGSYEITTTGGDDNNYYYTYQTGLLTVLLATNLDKQTTVEKVYPNPTTDFIYIDNSLIGEKFTIFNTTGLIVKNGILKTNKIDLTSLANGLYFLQINKDTHKIIKK